MIGAPIILRGFGLKVGRGSKGRSAAHIRDLIDGQPMLERVIEPMPRAREALHERFHAPHRAAMLRIVRDDGVRRRPMMVPGVGTLVAVTFTSAVDDPADPARFRRSRAVGAHFGLTRKNHQSGETDAIGEISKAGDAMVRTALHEEAHIMLSRTARFSSLRRWALGVAKRRGTKRAKVALARKLATVLLRPWNDESAFRFGQEAAAAA